jgi:hypothetical protein
VRKAETAIQLPESPAHMPVGAKIEPDPLEEKGVGGIAPGRWRESEMHPARKRPKRVNEALLRRKEKTTGLTGLAVGEKDSIEIARSRRLSLGRPLALTCHPRIHLTVFEVLSEGPLHSAHFLEVGVNHEELPAAHPGRHGKAAGGARLHAGKIPSLFLKPGHDVSQVFIVKLKRFPVQAPGLFRKRKVELKPGHLPHGGDLPKNPGQLRHERSRLLAIQMRDHDRDPEAMS